MPTQQSNPEENLKLLNELLLEEQIEREVLSKKIHYIGGSVATMKMFLKELETKNSKKNAYLRHLETIVQSTYDELEGLMDQAYPRKVTRIGLTGCLLRECDQLAMKYNSKINLITQITQTFRINKKQEVDIYKLCVSTIDFICEASYLNIEITLTLKNKNLIFKISGNGLYKAIINDSEQIRKLRIIKGRVLYLGANIGSKTNWKNQMEFKFSLEEEKKDPDLFLEG